MSVQTQVASLIGPDGASVLGKPTITFTGPHQQARRFIHAPDFSWVPVERAERYRVVLWHGRDVVTDVTVAEPRIALEQAAWESLPNGRIRMVVHAHDAAGALVGYSITRAFEKVPGWSGATPPARFSYAETATRIIRWLCSDVGVGRYDADAPPYFWHCMISNADDTVTENNRAFPALHNPMGVQAFVAYAQNGADPDLRAEALRRARALADFTIEHSTPAHHRYAYLPYHTIAEGKLGLHGGLRPDLGDIAEPNKAGHMGVAYLDLFDATGESRYRDAATRIAETLAATQKSDGSWPYRVNSETGYSEEEYTSTGVFALLLFDRIRHVIPDERYQQAYERILAWQLENPVRTGRWENIFDDTSYLGPYANQGNYDALFMGRFLLDHAADDPRFVSLAEDLFRWVDDNFVLYEEDPYVPYRPFTPSVTEQWEHYWPMDVHTANWLLFLVRLWDLTGNDAYRARAVGAANTITQCQMEDGRSTTYLFDADSGVCGPVGASPWYSCMFLPVNALLEAASRLA